MGVGAGSKGKGVFLFLSLLFLSYFCCVGRYEVEMHMAALRGGNE